MALDPITDYTKTQRIVLLIDLNPLLYLHNPKPYLTSLLSSIKTLLSFPPFSSCSCSSSSPCLFAFKMIFSSLSPLLSSSKLLSLIPNCPLTLSFNHPTSTLSSLSHIFDSFSASVNYPCSEVPNFMPPQASSLAASMRQLLHDYAWDPLVGDATTGMFHNCDRTGVRSNLIVLFSPLCTSVKSLSEFLNVDNEDECLGNVDLFNKRFCGYFRSVTDAFINRDMQFSWVDIRCDFDSSENKPGIDESELKFEFFQSGIRSLGWGFCSTDSIVLGSALVPFGLIYPKIGISWTNFNFNEFCKKVQAQLSLEIIDVSKKPLECKCCDLELIELKMLPRGRCDDALFTPALIELGSGHQKLEKNLLELSGDEITKLHVKAVQNSRECLKYKGNLSNPVLVCEFPGESGKSRKGSSDEFYAEKVLEMLAVELGDSVLRKSSPIWQIFLSFLYKEGYCALVSISNGKGDSHMGILKPFMVSSALLFIIDNDQFHSPNVAHDLGEGNLPHATAETKDITGKTKADSSHFCGLVDSGAEPLIDSGAEPLIDSGAEPLISVKSSQERDAKKKKYKKASPSPQDLTWSGFCKAAFENSKLDLGEVYFASGFNSSKKLKFLKCWMKQIKNSSSCSVGLPKSQSLECPKKTDDRLTVSHQESESEQPISSSASAGEKFLTEASNIQDEAALNCRSETFEAFFGNLSNKIQQGLESEAFDLGVLAERLVNSSIYWLSQKNDTQATSESRLPAEKSDNANRYTIVAELAKLLLREPKDLAARQKNNDPSFTASDPGSTSISPEKAVREYELQILFRMEILKSEVGVSIGDSMKQKFVKQICLLLETIQCHLEGGFFGDWSLETYVGKIIKSRYCQHLGEVVNRVYQKMDLLLFADEDESLSSHHLFNSEDNNSIKEKSERDQMGENHSYNDLDSTEDKTLPENYNGNPQGIKEPTSKLIEAKDRRERARKFASFTSWGPDLRRVWAPKQLKATKPKLDNLRKVSKRKDSVRASYDMVCETPMTEKRRSCSRGSQEDTPYCGNYTSGSVSKALFKDTD